MKLKYGMQGGRQTKEKERAEDEEEENVSTNPRPAGAVWIFQALRHHSSRAATPGGRAAEAQIRPNSNAAAPREREVEDRYDLRQELRC